MRLRLLPLLALLLTVPLVVPATAEQADPDPTPAYGGLDAPIRPGASLGGYCTFNFLFHDGVLDRRPDGTVEEPTAYIGTAAHCTDEIGEIVRIPGFGPIGRVVYDSDLVGSGVDFSLVEIPPALVSRANPTMLGWDGPHGVADPDDLALGDVVDLHGYGLVLGQNDLTRDRQGILMTTTDDDEYVINMPAVNGDSGAPLLHHATGNALGIVSRYGIAATPPSTDTGPLMAYIFRELEAAGLGDVVLSTIS